MIENKDKAFMPIEIKGKIIKNRFIRSAVNDHLGNVDGTVSDAEIEMYDTLGRGEIGVVITGHMSVSPSLFNTADSIATPCSVKTYGLEVECFSTLNRSQFATNSSFSSFVNWNRKRSGNRSMFRFTCSFNRLVSTL